MELNAAGLSAVGASPVLGPTAKVEELWTQFEKSSSLGSNHEILGRFAGSWKVRMDFDYFGYGPQYIGRGTAENRLLYGGRYLEMKLTLSFADQDYEASAVYAYDNVMGCFTYFLYDSHSTGFIQTSGTWNKKEQCIVEEGFLSNPMVGGRHEIKARRRFVSPDIVVYQMLVPNGQGGMWRSMEVRYDRLKFHG